MFGTRRKSRTERVAEEAWDNLTSVMESAGDTARAVGRRTSDLATGLADGAQAKVTSAADEAWTRASNAFDALAGRKPSKPWGWLAVAVLGGIAVGWAVATSAPRAVSAAMDRLRDEDEAEVPAMPGSPTPAGTRSHLQA
jgi:hypothetical protein